MCNIAFIRMQLKGFLKITPFMAVVSFVCGLHASTNVSPLVLKYNSPAVFFEEALVIGNGTIGATVYSGTEKDIISLNDITLWTGEPDKKVTSPDAHKAIPEIRSMLDKEDYEGADRKQKEVQGHYSENYQPLGRLCITYNDSHKQITDYERMLDIGNAILRAGYDKDGKAVECSYFASAPDSVIVIRIKSEDESGIDATISFDSELPHSTVAKGNDISVDGYAAYHSYPGYYNIDNKHLYDPDRGIRFRTIIRVITSKGTVKTYHSGEIKIKGADEAMILVANATSFNGFDKDPAREGRKYRKIAEKCIARAASRTYDELYDRHTRDYKALFDRVGIDLGTTEEYISNMPTDKQLRLYTDESQNNPELEALYFQYGRYLLISCSRTPGVPANLQGLWNEQMLPPWSSNYTSNINLEENYWAAETANLSELHMPLLKFIANLSKTGRTTAKAYYGVDKGWCLGQNTDIWAMTCPVGLNVGDPSWACWTMGGAWLSTHIWEHYLFTYDKEFLKEYYPVLKGAAEFCMEWLIEKDGWLVTSPGTSPENKFMTPDGYAGATSYGNTSDLAMTRECIIDAAKAAKELGVDKEFRKKVNATLKKLLPYRIGKKGNLQEWFHDWEDQDPRHRHQSHLFGLYPGHHLNVYDTPLLTTACAKTLEIKGSETTGWSTGWRVNLYARLKDGENAYNTYRRLLRYVSPDGYHGSDARRGGGTYPNLLDAHSPFQIDGNFGGCAGVIEMLMQSTEESIELLPAIPLNWKNGSVNGICARGGFVINMEWNDSKVTSLEVYSRNGGKTVIHYNGKKQTIKTKAKESIKIL